MTDERGRNTSLNMESIGTSSSRWVSSPSSALPSSVWHPTSTSQSWHSVSVEVRPSHPRSPSYPNEDDAVHQLALDQTWLQYWTLTVTRTTFLTQNKEGIVSLPGTSPSLLSLLNLTTRVQGTSPSTSSVSPQASTSCPPTPTFTPLSTLEHRRTGPQERRRRRSPRHGSQSLGNSRAYLEAIPSCGGQPMESFDGEAGLYLVNSSVLTLCFRESTDEEGARRIYRMSYG